MGNRRSTESMTHKHINFLKLNNYAPRRKRPRKFAFELLNTFPGNKINVFGPKFQPISLPHQVRRCFRPTENVRNFW